MFISQLGFSQIDTNLLIQKTEKFLNAYLDKDYQSMAEMTHPNVVSLGGGIDWVKKDLAADREALESLGFKYKSGEVGDPGKFHQSGEETLCFITQKLIVEIEGNDYMAEVPLLASSINEGSSWTFVSLDRFDANGLKDFVPSYNQEMGWPEIKPMEKVEDK